MLQLSKEKMELRRFYEGNFFAFMQYLNPQYMYGECHRQMADFLSSLKANEDQLVLFPREHLKSHILACYAVWALTKQPWLTTTYLTAGEDLAKVQMYAIKNMFLSDEYRALWPEMIELKETKRDKWTDTEINLDHPERKLRGIRDYSLMVKTVKSSATGLHCDLLLSDDIVVPKNAYTNAGRQEVENAVADFGSILNSGGRTKAVGTLYHPKDIYHQWRSSQVDIYDDAGNLVGQKAQYHILMASVENNSAGNGVFLWPRVKSPITGDWYGFDPGTLARKKAKYVTAGHLARFYAQYYNDTEGATNDLVTKDHFQYLNPRLLRYSNGSWWYNDNLLNVVAAMDLAWSDGTGKDGDRNDFTAIAVVAMDEFGNIYVLALDQFKTIKGSVYYKHLRSLYDVWKFRKVFIETNNVGKIIKGQIDDAIKDDGLSLTTIGKYQEKDKTKEERFALVLEPKYGQRAVWHTKGGLTPDLEEQLKKTKPPHDDLKDCVCTGIDNLKKPHGSKRTRKVAEHTGGPQVAVAHNRFGGRRAARA